MHNFIILFTIIMMAIFGFVATDIYLPSLPEISKDFHTNIQQIQMTISIFLLALSISQLIYGPIISKYDRKHILLIGIFVYIVASISCYSSYNIEMLIISRFFQGVGAAAGMVIWKVLVSDLYSKQEAPHIFTIVFPIIGLSPAISPVIGSYIDYYLGWEYSFLFLSAIGILTFILILIFIPERDKSIKKISIHPYNIIHIYINTFTTKNFLAYAMIPTITTAVYFAYVVESPFILKEYGFSIKTIGLSFLPLSISYVLGSIVAKKFLSIYSMKEVLLIGYLIFIFSALVMLTISMFEFNIILFLTPITILTFSNGFLISLGTAGCMNSCPDKLGYVSGLLGFIQLSIAGIATGTVHILTNGSFILLYNLIAILIIINSYFYYKMHNIHYIDLRNIIDKTINVFKL